MKPGILWNTLLFLALTLAVTAIPGYAEGPQNVCRVNSLDVVKRADGSFNSILMINGSFSPRDKLIVTINGKLIPTTFPHIQPDFIALDTGSQGLLSVLKDNQTNNMQISSATSNKLLFGGIFAFRSEEIPAPAMQKIDVASG